MFQAPQRKSASTSVYLDPTEGCPHILLDVYTEVVEVDVLTLISRPLNPVSISSFSPTNVSMESMDVGLVNLMTIVNSVPEVAEYLYMEPGLPSMRLAQS